MDHKASCEEIVTLYYDSIKRYCHSRLPDDFHGAEDCTQEVFYIFIKKYDSSSSTEGIRVWLYKTADKVIRNYLRREQKHDHAALEEVTFSDDGGLAMITNDTPLDILSEEERRLITAYYTAPDSKKAIAKHFGLTLPALYMAVFRIKKKLRDASGTK